MTREEIAEAILKMNDEDLKAFKNGINQITFEYGWEANLDNNEMINKLYYEDF